MSKRSSKLDTDTDLVAAEWAVRRAEGLDPAERAEFDRWLGEDPGAWRAFKESDRLWNDLADMDLRAVEGRSAVPRRRRLPAYAAIAAALVAAVIGVQILDQRPVRYESGLGEVRTVRLADGSDVTLGADSAIAVRFDDDGRHVRLRRGEAMFDVRHDPAKPFEVRAADTQVVVLGTRFTVKAAPDAVRVDVIQGVVRVAKTESPLLAPFSRPAPARKITRGERLDSRQGEPLQALPAIDPAEAAPWAQGRLVYENASLAEVVADLNRYSVTPVELGTRQLGELRVTAALNQDQVGQFLSSLPATLPVRIARGDAGEVVIEPAG
ncbi:MAG TPA: FecR domain-containing protein [Caulobacteraceae bacterium]|nr:FecR domain-containing protein [Caulobacteraceae bacterium]